MNENILKLFWPLAEGSDHERIQASMTLLSILQEKQDKSKKLCSELKYTLTRLVKGLASGRKFAKLGFATALTQLLRDFHQINAENVVECVKDNLKVSDSDSKNELVQILVGKVLAYMALIQSGKLQEARDDTLTQVTQELLEIQKKKIPLHQICVEALVQIIARVNVDTFAESVWPLLREELACGWEKCSPDYLLLILTVSKHHDHLVGKSFLQEHWSCKKIISEKNYSAIANVLLQSTTDHPIIHPVSMELIQLFSKKESLFISFWNDVIYEKVFTAGQNRKFLIFQLISESLKLASSADQVNAILSPNLIGPVLNHLSNKQQTLHGAAIGLLKSLVSVSRQLEGSLQVAVLLSLITPPGTVLFDNVVRTNFVNQLIHNLTPDGAKELSRILISNIQGNIITRTSSVKFKKSPDLLTQQRWSVSTLTSLVDRNIVEADMTWCNSILQFLVLSSYFDVIESADNIEKPTAPLDLNMKDILSAAFFKSLTKMTKSLGKGAKGYQSYVTCLYDVVQYAQTLVASPKLVKTSKKFDELVSESWQKMLSVVEKIHQKRQKSSVGVNDELAFELLFLHHGLLLFTQPKPAMDILQELHTCYEKASIKKRRRSMAKPGEEPEWVDVVIDLLMSLLSQQNQHLRTVVNIVFTMLCPHLTRTNLQLVLDVLKTDASSEDNPLDFEDEDMESEDEGIDEDTNGKENEDSDVDEEHSSTSEDEDEVEDDKVDDKLRLSVKSALGKAADDDEEESDDDMDDEAMFRLDEALAAAFKSRKKSKKEQVEREVQLKHYQMRCLDMVDILIKQTTSGALLVDLILPLLHLMEKGVREKSQKDLGDRAARIFTQLVKVKKASPDPSLDKKELLEMVKTLIENSAKVDGIPLLISHIANACIFDIHVLLEGEKLSQPSPVKTRAMAAKKENQESANKGSDILMDVLEIIEEALKNFFCQRDSHLSQVLFFTMFERDPILFWPLADTLLGYTHDPEVRIFCRTQACIMLSTIITKNTVQVLDANEWSAFSKKIISTVKQILHERNKGTLKPRYLSELLSLFHRVFSMLNAATVQDCVSEDFMNLIQTLKTSASSDGRSVINRIIGIFNARTSKKKEEKHEPLSPQKTGPDPKLQEPVPVTSSDTSVNKLQKTPRRSVNNSDHFETPKFPKSRAKLSRTLVNGDDEMESEDDDEKIVKSVKSNRRKSEIPPKSFDSNSVSVKKKKRKSLGDV